MAANIGTGWSNQEVKFLQENYGKIPTDLICIILDRSLKAVHRKSVKLGLKIKNLDLLDYFMNRIAISKKELNNHPCWEWIGYTNSHGYALLRKDQEKRRLAHRWAYEYFISQVPEGLELDHLCRVRHCVNPMHLEPVTHSENVKRGLGPVTLKLRHMLRAENAL